MILLVCGVASYLCWSLTGGGFDDDDPFVVNRQNGGGSVFRRPPSGWKRIEPSRRHVAEEEDFRIGKSCHWRQKEWRVFSFLSLSFPWSAHYYWDCRDCGTFSSEWRHCAPLTRRGKCPAASKFQDWDTAPFLRAASTYNVESSQPYPPVRSLTSYGVGQVRKVEYLQEDCPPITIGSMGGGGPCFNLAQCTTNSTTTKNGTTTMALVWPIPVYLYPGVAQRDFDAAIVSPVSNKKELNVRQTYDPTQACLLIVHVDDFMEQRVALNEYWNEGRNHYVYGVSRPIYDTRSSNGDDTAVHFDKAVIGSVVATNAQFRWGYDISLPLPALWQPEPPLPINNKNKNVLVHDGNATTTLEKENHPFTRGRRPILLSFRGSIQDTLQPYYQHRWLAAEYLQHPQNGRQRDANKNEQPEDRVEINVQCKHKTWWGDLVTIAPYDNDNDSTSNSFDTLLLESTFGFCPGGSHVTSYRFSEVLSAGGIPVLLPEVVTPYAPELDFDKCVIRVSQARIVDLPRLLLALSEQEIRQRQEECYRLYQLITTATATSTVGTSTSTSTSTTRTITLGMSLRLWTIRLQGAVQQAQLLLTQEFNNVAGAAE
jgi:hypothetical protein